MPVICLTIIGSQVLPEVLANVVITRIVLRRYIMTALSHAMVVYVMVKISKAGNQEVSTSTRQADVVRLQILLVGILAIEREVIRLFLVKAFLVNLYLGYLVTYFSNTVVYDGHCTDYINN